jgi:hypothetical protein
MRNDYKNWNRLTEKEKSDQFNADLERLRSGRGPDIRRDGKRIEPPFALRVSVRLRQMLSDGGETKETQKALMASGLTADRAQLLMRTALHYAWWNQIAARPIGGPPLCRRCAQAERSKSCFLTLFIMSRTAVRANGFYEVTLDVAPYLLTSRRAAHTPALNDLTPQLPHAGPAR